MIDGDRHIGIKANADEPLIRLENMTKTFGEHQVLQPINLEILEKETLVVIGASGSGKTTMLRCINHLETPTTGGVYLRDEPIGGNPAEFGLPWTPFLKTLLRDKGAILDLYFNALIYFHILRHWTMLLLAHGKCSA